MQSPVVRHNRCLHHTLEVTDSAAKAFTDLLLFYYYVRHKCHLHHTLKAT